MTWSIRPAADGDAASIVELLNVIIRTGRYTIMENPTSVEGQVEFIRTFPQRGVCHVAVCDESGSVLGIQDVQPFAPVTTPALRHVGEISTFVSLEVHRNGIGRALTRATFEAARRQGFAKIMATIRADNPQAIAFYRNRGFEIIGTARKHALIRGRYLDEVVMECWIGSGEETERRGDGGRHGGA